MGILSKLFLCFLLKMSSITGCTIYFVLLVSELQKLFRITVPSKLLVMCFLLDKPYMCNQRYFANENLSQPTTFWEYHELLDVICFHQRLPNQLLVLRKAEDKNPPVSPENMADWEIPCKYYPLVI